MDDLIRKVIADDDGGASWKAFWLAVKPKAWRITRQRRVMGRLAGRPEERENVALALMVRLRSDGFADLKDYIATCDQSGGGRFEAWLTVVTTYAAHDYVKAHPQYRRPSKRTAAAGPSADRWRDDDLPLPDSGPGDPGNDVEQTVMALEAFAIARRILTAPQLEVYARWLEGYDTSEIAEELGLPDAGAADKMLRAARARLREWCAKENAA